MKEIVIQTNVLLNVYVYIEKHDIHQSRSENHFGVMHGMHQSILHNIK